MCNCLNRIKNISFFFLSVPYEPPPNVIAASVSDTYINITWDHPSLSPEIWNIFQGYEVYIRRAGTTQINVTQVNEPVNSVTLTELEPLITYEVSVAAYTLTGVGKKSEAIAVNTTFGKVVFNRIQFICLVESGPGNPAMYYHPIKRERERERGEWRYSWSLCVEKIVLK